MENTNQILAANLVALRKENGLTQNEFAEQLGVTYQAVSKWENAKSAPDIGFLPQIADIFGCTLDKLFSRNNPTPTATANVPFEDDGVIRGVVYRGNTMLSVIDPLINKFTFEVKGNAENVQSRCSIAVTGNVMGGCKAGHSVQVGRDLNGGCKAGHSVSVENNLSGECHAGHSLSVGNNLNGTCTAGFAVSCGNNIEMGDVSAGNKIMVQGAVNAKQVQCKGSISCETLHCDEISGKVVFVKGKKKKVE